MSAESTTTHPLLDVKSLAAILGCSTRHIYRLSDAGRMPAPLHIGFLVRWRREDIETWIANDCRPVRTALAAKLANRVR